MQSPFEHETGWGRENLEEDFKTQEQVWKQPYIHKRSYIGLGADKAMCGLLLLLCLIVLPFSVQLLGMQLDVAWNIGRVG